MFVDTNGCFFTVESLCLAALVSEEWKEKLQCVNGPEPQGSPFLEYALGFKLLLLSFAGI